jgi:hypothetical protein
LEQEPGSRAATRGSSLPYRAGVKLFGKGEWAAAKNGERGKRAWRKLHLGVDETQLLGAVELTDNTVDNANVVCDLFSQDENSIERFGADAA